MGVVKTFHSPTGQYFNIQMAYSIKQFEDITETFLGTAYTVEQIRIGRPPETIDSSLNYIIPCDVFIKPVVGHQHAKTKKFMKLAGKLPQWGFDNVFAMVIASQFFTLPNKKITESTFGDPSKIAFNYQSHDFDPKINENVAHLYRELILKRPPRVSALPGVTVPSMTDDEEKVMKFCDHIIKRHYLRRLSKLAAS